MGWREKTMYQRTTNQHRYPRTRQIWRIGQMILAYLLLSGWAALTLVPFLWMLSSSLKDFGQIFRFPPVFIPDPIKWQNYSKLMTTFPFLTWAKNSALVSVTVTLGHVMSCSLAAFAFARIPFRGRERLFFLYLATMMIPSQVTLIPTYILMNRLSLINKLSALIIPGILGGPFGTFLLRQFFMTIPQELEDAARIDGASYFVIYHTIILPLSKPALATLAVFIFLGVWNDFLWPLVILDSPQLKTLPVGVAGMVGQYSTDWGLLMAGATLSVVPILAIYVAAQRYFVEGITMTGLKS
jgi:multiple sugar transport system permease protein